MSSSFGCFKDLAGANLSSGSFTHPSFNVDEYHDSFRSDLLVLFKESFGYA